MKTIDKEHKEFIDQFSKRVPSQTMYNDPSLKQSLTEEVLERENANRL